MCKRYKIFIFLILPKKFINRKSNNDKLKIITYINKYRCTAYKNEIFKYFKYFIDYNLLKHLL